MLQWSLSTVSGSSSLVIVVAARGVLQHLGFEVQIPLQHQSQ